MVQFFKVVSDETRLRILLLLAKEDLYVCQMQGIMNISQPNISKHLSKLKDLGYVEVKREDKFMKYTLRFPTTQEENLFQTIYDNVAEYKLYQEDSSRLQQKDNFLCKNIEENKREEAICE